MQGSGTGSTHYYGIQESYGHGTQDLLACLDSAKPIRTTSDHTLTIWPDQTHWRASLSSSVTQKRKQSRAVALTLKL